MHSCCALASTPGSVHPFCFKPQQRTDANAGMLLHLHTEAECKCRWGYNSCLRSTFASVSWGHKDACRARHRAWNSGPHSRLCGWPRPATPICKILLCAQLRSPIEALPIRPQQRESRARAGVAACRSSGNSSASACWWSGQVQQVRNGCCIDS